MKVEFLNDTKGNHEAVKISYADWVGIARQLSLPVDEPDFYDKYRLTESLNSILNGLVALTSRELRKERRSAQPDQARVSELSALKQEALSVRNDTGSFADIAHMDQLIQRFSPILLAHQKKSLV